MSKIIRIGTAVPAYCHEQHRIAGFMNRVYGFDNRAAERISMVYDRSLIDNRYSIIPDFSLPENEWQYFTPSPDMEPFPKLDERMKWYRREAPVLAEAAIQKTLTPGFPAKNITHLITVSCTGMSAPGIDIELVKRLGMAGNCQRTSVNFMGCYAAIHGLKIADAICRADEKAIVLVVSVELCTIHFQKEPTPDNIASSLLFSDGAAAVLVVPTSHHEQGNALEHFYSELALEGEEDMSWNMSENGFLMRLSSYVPRLIENHIDRLLQNALCRSKISRDKIGQWAIHPGGKKILRATEMALALDSDALRTSYDVLRDYGNMSSVTILFVLQKMLEENNDDGRSIFAAAFGPGITIETMLLNGTRC